MPYEDELDDYELEEDEEDAEDEADEAPSDVFVSMAFGRDGSEEAYRVIRRACKDFDLTARRAHQDQIPGSPGIDEAVEALIDVCDFAVIDLTHERPSVAHEIGLCDGEYLRAFILLIAKAGTPRFGNIQCRMVNYYTDLDHLRRIMEKQLGLMIELWDQLPDEGDDEDENEDDD